MRVEYRQESFQLHSGAVQAEDRREWALTDTNGTVRLLNVRTPSLHLGILDVSSPQREGLLSASGGMCSALVALRFRHDREPV